MFKLTQLGSALCGAIAMGAFGLVPLGIAQAQQTPETPPTQPAQPTAQPVQATPPAASTQQLERVEITGSAVRRIQGETALPVQIIKREDIEKTGATSVTELIQALPSMQGFTNDGASVGGTGAGFSGASIHGLGEDKTLVLLNGRRLASYAGQNLNGDNAGVDLNVIPLAAIERVEVLTDGASALYGADAVAGVVNFITKKESTEGVVALGGSFPKDGGRERRVSLSKGFGNYDEDGWNVLFAGSYEKRTALRSVDRDFADSSMINFSENGRRYRLFNGSPRSIPGNLKDATGTYNPYLRRTGACGKQSFNIDGICYYDYIPDIEIIPERERSAFFVSASKALDEQKRLYAEALLANTLTNTAIAPPPGEILIPAGLYPEEAPLGGEAKYRITAVGPRKEEQVSKARHFVIGSDGRLDRFDYDISYTHSVNTYKDSLKSGWMSQNSANAALRTVNPFVPLEEASPAGVQALLDAQVRGFFLGGESTLDYLQMRASTEVAELPGGALSVAAGVNYLRDQIESTPSELAAGANGDTRFGDSSALVAYKAKRTGWGAFAEILAPVHKQVELGGSLRHDRYSDMGGATTAKGTVRWQPTTGVLLRGSLGSGFKAPTVAQINATQQLFGVTSGAYRCDPGSGLQQVAASLGAQCHAGIAQQYDVVAAGTKDLEPEKSTQWTLGVRLEPSASFSFGADLWNAKVRNLISYIDEAVVFDDPVAWRDRFTSVVDPATGNTNLAMRRDNANLGTRENRGIDLDVLASTGSPVGRITSRFIATYMLKDSYQLIKNGPRYSSLGRYGEDGDVKSRWLGRWINTLQSGNFAHTLTLAFRSGYKDQPYTDDGTVEEIGPDGQSLGAVAMERKVKNYVTFDWQTAWSINKQWRLVGGILNLTDRDPPMSLKTSGGGHMIGYDDRYYDARGRTFYLNGSYTF
ncbi:TonB-dependent receptor [Aquabacterium sp. A7-Y]|uniref:TonB-dependent receptor plug domain-containing protein n=1 Tax=Aquabacterium sp. A7-Y TaxID=1349605 RepID=UPI00223D6224|nr:TonB-dependent receptor [Aquabacterium sp. A7-Y]MCW7541520.1 TonB-dependent receptor [Aquabacterium sp. A7-Y]